MSGGNPFGLSSRISSMFFSTYSNTRYSFPFLLNASFRLTMFSCLSILRILTSRSVVFLTISSSVIIFFVDGSSGGGEKSQVRFRMLFVSKKKKKIVRFFFLLLLLFLLDCSLFTPSLSLNFLIATTILQMLK